MSDTGNIIWTAIGSLIRHALTGLAGVLVAIGWIVPAQQGGWYR